MIRKDHLMKAYGFPVIEIATNQKFSVIGTCVIKTPDGKSIEGIMYCGIDKTTDRYRTFIMELKQFQVEFNRK